MLAPLRARAFGWEPARKLLSLPTSRGWASGAPESTMSDTEASPSGAHEPSRTSPPPPSPPSSARDTLRRLDPEALRTLEAHLRVDHAGDNKNTDNSEKYAYAGQLNSFTHIRALLVLNDRALLVLPLNLL
jgi:hypothetical protein